MLFGLFLCRFWHFLSPRKSNKNCYRPGTNVEAPGTQQKQSVWNWVDAQIRMSANPARKTVAKSYLKSLSDQLKAENDHRVANNAVEGFFQRPQVS